LAFQKITRIRSKLAAVGCVSLLAVVGCSRPKQYRLGEAIPVGSYTLSMSMTEMTHQLHQRQLVIFYRCNGAGWTSLSQSEREEFGSSCRSPRFTLLDGGENEYAPEEVELATMYRADRTAYQEAYTNDEDSRVINPSVESKNKKEADKWAEAALYALPSNGS